MLRPGHFSGLNLRDVEHNHVLVEVVEVTGVALVPVVGELGGLVPMSVDAAVVSVDTERVVVEDGAENACRIDGVAFAGSQLDRASVGEGKTLARTLPERNSLRIDELGVLVMEGVGLEEHIRGRAELGQHNNVLEVFRGESLHAAHVEQSRHARQPVDGESHMIGGVTDKIGIEDCIPSGQTLAVLLIKAIQQVNSSGIACTGVSAAAVHIVERLSHHVVDGAHDEVVKGHRHALLNFIEKHGEEAVELGSGREGLVQRLLLHGALDLERGHLVEELDVHVGLVEHVGIVGGPIGQVPRLVFGGLRKTRTDLLKDGTVTPIVHKDGGSAAGVGTVDEDHLADMIDEGTNKPIKGVGVEDGIACIHNALQVFGNEIILAESLNERIIDDLVNLFYFHCCSPFSLVG